MKVLWCGKQLLAVFTSSFAAMTCLLAEPLTPEQAAVLEPKSEVEFIGMVAEVVDGTNKRAVYINFGKPYPGEVITAVILENVRHYFTSIDLTQLTGKTVRIRGLIEEASGHPRVMLRSADQLEILPPNVPSPPPKQ